MKKILPLFVIGILVLSGLGVTVSGLGVAAVIDGEIIFENEPPNIPTIKGPICRPPGTYEYTFNTTDPDGDDIYYIIYWGDGTHDDWFGPFASGEGVTRNHTFSEWGSYGIKAKSKDTHGAEGDWGYMEVIISKSKQIINNQSDIFLIRRAIYRTFFDKIELSTFLVFNKLLNF